MSQLDDKLQRTETSGSGRASQTLTQLIGDKGRYTGRYEIISQDKKGPVVLVTIGCERVVWERVPSGRYERVSP